MIFGVKIPKIVIRFLDCKPYLEGLLKQLNLRQP